MYSCWHVANREQIMKKLILIKLALLFQFSLLSAQNPYDARIAPKEVLTPAPAPTPKINGPKIYGVRPGKKFIFRIPCQGKRPISFDAHGLPEGLVLDKTTGVITGVAPGKIGDYKIEFTAKNSVGNTSREFKLVVGDKIALTPPTGWNSWGGHMVGITDEIMRKTADVFIKEGLADVGFQYISIDDCWMRPVGNRLETQPMNGNDRFDGVDWNVVLEGTRDQERNILPNDKFPDMKAMTDCIHSFGLKVGIYSSPGELTCQKYAGSRFHEKQDAEQYAKWGFDLLKYDQCATGTYYLKKKREENPDYRYSEYWNPMAGYLHEQDRDILMNLCQYGWEDPWKWAPGLGISTWRTGGDLNHHVDTYFEQALKLASELREYS